MSFNYTLFELRPPAIKLAGLRSNVADLKDAIKEMRSEFREATTYSKICRWTWSADDVTFHDFPLRVSRAIEQQFEVSGSFFQ